MKLPPLRRSVFAAAFISPWVLAGSLDAATQATTDPVGFITVSVGGGSQASPTLSLVAPTLFKSVDWQGAISTIASTAITVSGTPWTAGQYNGTSGSYFVEVTTGTKAGAWSDIVSTATGGITTADDLSGFASSGDTIRIRKHVVLSDFLGTQDSAGIQGGTSAAAADEVMIYDGAVPAIYWYYNGTAIPAGWYDLSYNSAANIVIAPNQGVVIKRKTGGTVNFVSSGTVKTGNTYIPITAGINVVPAIASQGLTLSTSGLYTGSATTGFRGGSSPANSDLLTIYSGSTQPIYWYYTGTAIPAGWYDLSYNAATNIAIAPGSAFVINRISNGASFNWVVPTPTSF